MSPGWFSRRRSSGRRRRAADPEPSLVGFTVLLRRSETDQRSADILSALARRYEVEVASEDGLQFHVLMTDVFDRAEAVVRLSSVLDELDMTWETLFQWPEATGPAARAPRRPNDDEPSD